MVLETAPLEALRFALPCRQPELKVAEASPPVVVVGMMFTTPSGCVSVKVTAVPSMTSNPLASSTRTVAVNALPPTVTLGGMTETI